MTFLVTGGAGFVGSHLCEELVRRGEKVICFDNLSTGRLSNISEFKEKLIFVEGNVNDLSSIEQVFKEHSIKKVFHYAAIVGVQRTLEQPLEVLNDVIGIRNILDLCVKYAVEKIVFASSSEVYGEPVQIPESEDGHINAKLPYAVTKLFGEKLLEAYFLSHNLKTCSLRFFNVYGPRQESSDYGFVTGIFIRQALKSENLTVFGDGTQTRDFVFIKDNVDVAILAMNSDSTNGKVINIGTGRPTTILDLAERIIKLTGNNSKPILVPVNRQDVRHRFPDVSRMVSLLRFRPTVSLDDGIKITIEWYKNVLK